MYYLGTFDDVVHRYSPKKTGELTYREIQTCLFRLCILSPGQWILNDGFLLHSDGGRESLMDRDHSLMTGILEGGLVRLAMRNPDIGEAVAKMAEQKISSYVTLHEFLRTEGGQKTIGSIQRAHELGKNHTWGPWDTDSAFIALASMALRRLDSHECREFYGGNLADLECILSLFLRMATAKRRAGHRFGCRDLFEKIAIRKIYDLNRTRTWDNTPENIRKARQMPQEWAQLRLIMRVANEIYHTAHALCHATEIDEHGNRFVRNDDGALTYRSPLFSPLQKQAAPPMKPAEFEDLFQSLSIPSLPLSFLRRPDNREVLLKLSAVDDELTLARARKEWATEFFNALASGGSGRGLKLADRSAEFEEAFGVHSKQKEKEKPVGKAYSIFKGDTLYKIAEKCGEYGTAAFIGSQIANSPQQGTNPGGMLGFAGAAFGGFSYCLIDAFRSHRKRVSNQSNLRSQVHEMLALHEFAGIGFVQYDPEPCRAIVDSFVPFQK